MSDARYKTENESGARSEDDRPVSRSRDDRQMPFDCCDSREGDAMRVCPCRRIMRKHPLITAAMLALMGLAFFLIPAGAILGIIAFLRTI